MRDHVRGDKPQDPPRGKPVFMPRTAGAYLGIAAKAVLARRRSSGTRLLLDWPEVVGSDLARRAEPLRLVGAVLTIACQDVDALELQHLAPQIVSRINGYYGRDVVSRLKLAAAGRPSAGFGAPPAPPRPVAIEGIEDPGLRAVLERLGGHVARRDRKTR